MYLHKIVKPLLIIHKQSLILYKLFLNHNIQTIINPQQKIVNPQQTIINPQQTIVNTPVLNKPPTQTQQVIKQPIIHQQPVQNTTVVRTSQTNSPLRVD